MKLRSSIPPLLLAVTVLAACSKPPEKAGKAVEASQPAQAAATAAAAPLNPVIAAAVSCVAECKTLYRASRDAAVPTDLELPVKFADLLSDKEIRSKFEAGVKALPPEYQGSLTARPDTQATGSLGYVIEKAGGRAYFYILVRFDPPGETRTYADVAVDVATKDVAILIRPTPNLDEYYITGPEQLQALTLVEAAASDTRMGKQELKLAQDPSSKIDWDADPFTLPLQTERASGVIERLTYLNSKYVNGRLLAVEPVADLVEARRLRQEAAWYAADLNFSRCVQSMSPAERIAVIQEAGVNARTKDRNDSSGRLVEVEVSYEEGTHERYYRYFKLQGEASLAKHQPIADKYR